MEIFEIVEDGYEIVVTILENDVRQKVVQADAYYKDFELYRILVIANSVQKAVKFAIEELLQNHPFEKVIKEY